MGKMCDICMIRLLFVEFSADGQQSESIEAKVDEFYSKLCEICMIHCKLKSKKKFGILHVVLEDGKSKNVYGQSHVLFGRWTGTFAMRLPSLSQGMECGDSGITFDIFTHVSTGFFFFFEFTKA